MPLQHKSPETIYRGQEAYVRIDAQAFQEHGEVKITGEPIIADEVVKKVNRNGFEITYLTYLVDLFDKLGGKSTRSSSTSLPTRARKTRSSSRPASWLARLRPACRPSRTR